MTKFDIVVVGAGSGGSITARFAAKSGYKVCLIDSKRKDKIGEKICGDAVGREIFDFLKIPHPKGDELVNKIKGALLYSPDLSSKILIDDPKQTGYIIDRLLFGQRLLEEALSEGVDKFLPSTHVLRPIIKEGQVIGVIIKGENGEEEIFGNMIVDASGFHSVLKKFIDYPFLEKELPKSDDSIVCYREIIDFKHEEIIENSDYISIMLNQKRAPGGYIWYFPRNDRSVNMGIGIHPDHKADLKSIYEREVYDKYVGKSPVEKISSGGGIVSVCKPMWTCVSDGIVFVGDSGCLVNPLHGGGIDPSMRAGYYAVEAYRHATNFKNYDATSLWKYNELVQKNIGAPFAALDLLRIALQGISNEDLNFGMKQGLLSGDEIIEISSKGNLTLNFFSTVGKIIKGFNNPSLLLNLNFIRTRMGKIRSLYRSYPMSPYNLGKWIEKVEEVYSEIIDKFRKKDLEDDF